MQKGGLVPIRHTWELYIPLPIRINEKIRLFIPRQMPTVVETLVNKDLSQEMKHAEKHA